LGNADVLGLHPDVIRWLLADFDFLLSAADHLLQ
jgi:hypothetical protein